MESGWKQVVTARVLGEVKSRNPHRDGEWLEAGHARHQRFPHIVAIRIVMESGWKEEIKQAAETIRKPSQSAS